MGNYIRLPNASEMVIATSKYDYFFCPPIPISCPNDFTIIFIILSKCKKRLQNHLIIGKRPFQRRYINSSDKTTLVKK